MGITIRGIKPFKGLIHIGSTVLGPSLAWQTPAGSLGEFEEFTTFNKQLIATDRTGKPVVLSFRLGSLPEGITFNSTTGVLSGTFANVDEDLEFEFSVTASTDEFSFDRTFSITVTAIVGTTVNWVTPSGTVAVMEMGSTSSVQLVATSKGG